MRGSGAVADEDPYHTWQLSERVIQEVSDELARERDAYCRRLLEARMPRRLHFLIDRPEALRRVLRLVPRWRPTMTIVRLGVFDSAYDAWFAVEQWVQRYGNRDLSGYVFTSTTTEGMPSEIYGAIRGQDALLNGKRGGR